MRFLAAVICVSLLSACQAGDSILTDIENVESGAYERELARKQAALRQLERSNTETKREVDARQGKLQRLDNRIHELRRDIGSLERQIAKAETDIALADDESPRVRKRNARAKIELEELKVELTDLRQKLKGRVSEEDYKALVKRHAELQKAIRALIDVISRT